MFTYYFFDTDSPKNAKFLATKAHSNKKMLFCQAVLCLGCEEIRFRVRVALNDAGLENAGTPRGKSMFFVVTGWVRVL